MFSNKKNTLWRSADSIPEQQGIYPVKFQNGELGTALYGTFGWLPSRNGQVTAWREPEGPSEIRALRPTCRPKELDE